MPGMNTSTSPLPRPLLARLPRMADWLLVTLLLGLLVWLLAPQQLPVSLYKLSLVSLAAVTGYWIDRSLFPYARPDIFVEQAALDLASDTLDLASDAPESGLSVLRCETAQVALLANAAMLRRAIIVAAAMLSISLGA